jgi:hypothetical protein
MLDYGSFVTVIAAGLLVGLLVALIARLVRLRSCRRYPVPWARAPYVWGPDAWVSVRLAYVEQADGILPIGVVRAQNSHASAAIVSVSMGRAPLAPLRWLRDRCASAPLRVRSPKVSRRPRPPQGTLLGAVSGGAVRVWEVPLPCSAPLPVVKVRVDHLGPRTKVFAWALDNALVRGPTTVEAPRRPASDPQPRSSSSWGH